MTMHSETRVSTAYGVLDRSQSDGRRYLSVVREGTVAGAAAGGGVALWYLFHDLMVRRPLLTPQLLGRAFGHLFDIQLMTDDTTAAVLGYTVVHFLCFVVLGIVGAAVLRVAWRQATVLVLAFLLFVVAEMAFFVAIGLMNQATPDGMLGWSQLAAGNIIGCTLLWAVFWRTHPELPNEIRSAMRAAGTWPMR